MSDVAELSLAEELGKAIDESVSVDQRTPTAESNSPSDASPPEAGDQQPESDSRARDAQGRFVRHEAQESGQPEVAPQAPEAPAEQPRQVDLPPSTWTPAAKAEYANLPEL